ncbi:putative nuclease HARBI1 [Lineus longissimus]|uniref:putative nuclease HARBI1 n=1 Tax=Lineus longissimus TaxID=88925 RepID=UPI00315CBEE4
MARFPRVIGAIDGTHCRIKKPSINENVYVNRKGFHSINVMLVCDWNMIINNCVAKYPGGSHDAFILHSSALGQAFERNPPNGWLLGDSGYPSKRWLLTPLANGAAQSIEERRYQRRQIKARNVIERCNGVLKQRFRCLRKEMQYSPDKACLIIQACCVLHNIAVRSNIPIVEDSDDSDDSDSDSDAGDDDFPERYRDMTGNQIRQDIIDTLR